MEIVVKGDQKEIETLIKCLRGSLNAVNADIAAETALLSLRDAFVRRGATLQ